MSIEICKKCCTLVDTDWHIESIVYSKDFTATCINCIEHLSIDDLKQFKPIDDFTREIINDLIKEKQGD